MLVVIMFRTLNGLSYTRIYPIRLSAYNSTVAFTDTPGKVT